MNNVALNISVLMPAFNEEHHIKKAIHSILTQSIVDLELIVIDDGSTDGTLQLIKSFDDSRIKLIHNSCNQGVIRCLNQGLQESRGKYIARMDADDISLPGRLLKQFNVMEEIPKCVAIGTGVFYLNYRDDDYRKITPVTQDAQIRHEMIKYNPINTGSAMYRRSALETVGGFDENSPRGEGYAVLLKLAKIGSLMNIPDAEYVYFYRKNANNRSAHDRFRARNRAMAKMTLHAGALSGHTVLARLASSAWLLYHAVPRPIQVVLRNLMSDSKHEVMTNEELKRIEAIYEEL